jgi:hypothetical protein
MHERSFPIEKFYRLPNEHKDLLGTPTSNNQPQYNIRVNVDWSMKAEVCMEAREFVCESLY